MSGFSAHFVYDSSEGRNMDKIKLYSFGKINLSIDVKGILESGMHQVDMIMQHVVFHDDVTVSYEKDNNREPGDISIKLKTNRYYIPVDNRNTAYKAAELMIKRYGNKMAGGVISIDIVKRIPVAGGMAGGSGNAAAVLHGINALWNLDLTLQELCEMGKEIGSDVPFCVIGQAKRNRNLPLKVRTDAAAGTCARATGTGTELELVRGFGRNIVIAKPDLFISTKEVYKGIDSCVINERPDNDRLAEYMNSHNFEEICRNCINVLENYTLKQYPEIEQLKKRMKELAGPELVLMSGSGPTVFGVCKSFKEAQSVCETLRKDGYEAYWTKTMK